MTRYQEVDAILQGAMSHQTRVVTEDKAKRILAEYGVRVPAHALVNSQDEAAAQAGRLGFPLVAKIVSPQILHKTDVQGVQVGLSSERAVRDAFNDMHQRFSNQPRVDIKGVLLEKMVPPGIELIAGLHNDPTFGPVIMVGLGGIYTELFGDVSFRMLPITKGDAMAMLNGLKGSAILKGFRGAAPIDLEMLAEALVRIGQLGIDTAPYYESVDFNPIVAYPGDYQVIDAKILLRDAPADDPLSSEEADISFMDTFFNPRSVALVGASASPRRIGNSVLLSLTSGFPGKIYPVNPTRTEIMGIPTYPSLDDIKEPVDLAVIVIDLLQAPSLVQKCGELGIHNVVIISGGGKELGGERAAAEGEIKRLAKAHKVRVIGPNCIGMFNAENRLDCAFQGPDRMIRPKMGDVAFLSQSGTLGISFMETADTFGLSKMISYGNRSDVDEADMIWYLAHDPKTKVIGLYVEGFDDGRKFVNTARKVISEAGKPIVVWKVGNSDRGVKQAALHTGSLAGSYEVIRGAFEQAGIISVDSYEELAGVLNALSWQRLPQGNRVAMVMNGAGPVVAAMDHFDRLGLEVAKLTEESATALHTHYPPAYVVGNPCDLTGSATVDDYRFALQTFMDDPNVDIIMPWFVFQDDPLEDTIVGVLEEFQTMNKKPILCGSLGGPYTERISASIEAAQIPMYHSVLSWVTAAGALLKWSRLRRVAK